MPAYYCVCGDLNDASPDDPCCFNVTDDAGRTWWCYEPAVAGSQPATERSEAVRAIQRKVDSQEVVEKTTLLMVVCNHRDDLPKKLAKR